MLYSELYPWVISRCSNNRAYSRAAQQTAAQISQQQTAKPTLTLRQRRIAEAKQRLRLGYLHSVDNFPLVHSR